MVSYEVTLGLTIVGALMVYGTIRLDEMVRWQAENAWGIFVQPIGFILFFAAAVAESKRIPFDLPEGESEIVAGILHRVLGHEVRDVLLLRVRRGRFLERAHGDALLRRLAPAVPRSDGLDIAFGDTVLLQQTFSHPVVIVLGVLAFIGKTIALCWLQLMIRWTLPRFRYDQLMRLGWRKLLPASLVNILATGLVILAIGSVGQSVLDGLRAAAELTQAGRGAGRVCRRSSGSCCSWLRPPSIGEFWLSTAAQLAASLGGTRTAKMGA